MPDSKEFLEAKGRLSGLLLQVAFLACIALLVILSWIPGSEMVRTGVSGRLEHTAAYFLTAIIMGLAFRGRPRLIVQALVLVMLAAILEAGQRFVPGRNSAFLDFASSSVGVVIGGVLMWATRPQMLQFLGLDHIHDGDRH